MQNKKMVVISIVVLLVAFFAGGTYYKSLQNKSNMKVSKEQASTLQRDYSLVLGDKNAKVQLVEFFDPACGACAYFYPKVKKLMKEKNGDIKLVFRYYLFFLKKVLSLR